MGGHHREELGHEDLGGQVGRARVVRRLDRLRSRVDLRQGSGQQPRLGQWQQRLLDDHSLAVGLRQRLARVGRRAGRTVCRKVWTGLLQDWRLQFQTVAAFAGVDRTD